MCDVVSFKNGAVMYCKTHKRTFLNGGQCPQSPEIPKINRDDVPKTVEINNGFSFDNLS